MVAQLTLPFMAATLLGGFMMGSGYGTGTYLGYNTASAIDYKALAEREAMKYAYENLYKTMVDVVLANLRAKLGLQQLYWGFQNAY